MAHGVVLNNVVVKFFQTLF